MLIFHPSLISCSILSLFSAVKTFFERSEQYQNSNSIKNMEIPAKSLKSWRRLPPFVSSLPLNLNNASYKKHITAINGNEILSDLLVRSQTLYPAELNAHLCCFSFVIFRITAATKICMILKTYKMSRFLKLFLIFLKIFLLLFLMQKQQFSSFF